MSRHELVISVGNRLSRLAEKLLPETLPRRRLWRVCVLSFI